MLSEMLVILLKELSQFFSSLTGYIILAFFLIISALVMWILPDTSVMEYGYATMQPFFMIAPWLLILLTSALTGKQLAEEKRTQTIELLLTRPVSIFAVVWGKFLASFILLGFALLMTLPFPLLLGWLTTPLWNIDVSAIAGSYVGLWLMCTVFISCGLLVSSLTPNQVASFLLSTILNIVLFYGMFGVSKLFAFKPAVEWLLQWLSLYWHYQSLARGVIDLRDIVYFLSLAGFLLFCTQLILESRK